MTVSSSVSRAGPYVGDGSTVKFTFAMVTQLTTDLDVVTSVTIGGAVYDTTLANGTDYTVTLNADQGAAPGGFVTLLTAPAAATLVTIIRDIPETQTSAFPNNGGFYPEVLETSLDRITMMVQQIKEAVSRAAVGSASGTTDPLTQIANYASAAQTAAAAAVPAASAAAASATSAGNSATAAAASAASVNMPVVTGNANKFLKTNGTTMSWDWPVLFVQTALTASATLSTVGIYTAAMTAAGQTLTLPDATSLTPCGVNRIVHNTGSIPFALNDNAGNLKCVLAAGQMVGISLEVAGTAAGSWAIHNFSKGGEVADVNLLSTTVAQATASSGSSMTVCAMSATQAILAWCSASVGAWTAVLTLSGNTIQVGTPTQIVTGVCYSVAVSSVSTTQAVAAVAATNGAAGVALTISGTGTSATVAAGTAVYKGATAQSLIASAALSSTAIIVAHGEATSSLSLYTATISGTGTSATITWSTSGTSVNASNISVSISIDVLTAGSAYILTAGTASGNPSATVFTYSAGTFTIGTSYLAPNQVGGSGYVVPVSAAVVAVSSTLAVFSWGARTGTNLELLSISGTTITPLTLEYVGKCAFPLTLGKGASDYFLVGAAEVVRFNVDTTTSTITTGARSSVSTFTLSSLVGKPPLFGNDVMLAALNSSSYPSLKLLQLGV